MPGRTYAENRDPKLPDQRIVIGEFKGLAPTQDPHDLDPGLAAIQVNCFAMHPGELRCRQGIKQVVFSS